MIEFECLASVRSFVHFAVLLLNTMHSKAKVGERWYAALDGPKDRSLSALPTACVCVCFSVCYNNCGLKVERERKIILCVCVCLTDSEIYYVCVFGIEKGFKQFWSGIHAWNELQTCLKLFMGYYLFLFFSHIHLSLSHSTNVKGKKW